MLLAGLVLSGCGGSTSPMVGSGVTFETAPLPAGEEPAATRGDGSVALYLYEWDELSAKWAKALLVTEPGVTAHYRFRTGVRFCWVVSTRRGTPAFNFVRSELTRAIALNGVVPPVAPQRYRLNYTGDYHLSIDGTRDGSPCSIGVAIRVTEYGPQFRNFDGLITGSTDGSNWGTGVSTASSSRIKVRVTIWNDGIATATHTRVRIDDLSMSQRDHSVFTYVNANESWLSNEPIRSLQVHTPEATVGRVVRLTSKLYDAIDGRLIRNLPEGVNDYHGVDIGSVPPGSGRIVECELDFRVPSSPDAETYAVTFRSAEALYGTYSDCRKLGTARYVTTAVKSYVIPECGPAFEVITRSVAPLPWPPNGWVVTNTATGQQVPPAGTIGSGTEVWRLQPGMYNFAAPFTARVGDAVRLTSYEATILVAAP
jgi:hypothetical protein